MRKDKDFDIPSSTPTIWIISAGTGLSAKNITLDDEISNPDTNRLKYEAAPNSLTYGATLTVFSHAMHSESIHTFEFTPGVVVQIQN